MNCPLCKRQVPAGARECPQCRADLTLLVDLVDHVGKGLVRAEQLTREGRLGEAVWLYMEVLEADPDNRTARKQVGQVVTAVREFDRVSPARAWKRRLARQGQSRKMAARIRQALQIDGRMVLVSLALLTALILGYCLGSRHAAIGTSTAPNTTAGKEILKAS